MKSLQQFIHESLKAGSRQSADKQTIVDGIIDFYRSDDYEPSEFAMRAIREMERIGNYKIDFTDSGNGTGMDICFELRGGALAFRLSCKIYDDYIAFERTSSYRRQLGDLRDLLRYMSELGCRYHNDWWELPIR